MNETWKQFEGKVVDGKFRLQKYLGHSDQSMVFLTELEGLTPKKAAVKLITSSVEVEEPQLAEWKLASTLSHPHLLQIFESGRCELGNGRMLYVVMEYAEESLADIPPDRHLSPAEAKEILPPVLSALTYLHRQNLIHGHIKPSNIMAAADQVKLSVDGVRSQAQSRREKARGSSIYDPPESASGVSTPASDIWSLGMTLATVSALQLPAPRALGEPAATENDPYVEMVGHLVDPNSRRRWTIARISAWLNEPEGAIDDKQVEPQASPLKWILGAAAIVALALLAFWGLHGRPQEVQKAPIVHNEPAATPTPAVEPPVMRSEPPPAPKMTAPPKAATASLTTSPRRGAGAVQKRVLPQVPRSARRTVQGHIRVNVKVTVDVNGNVTATNLETPGPSAYFARIAREAAQEWKFSPAQGAGSRAWILRFVFTRRGVEANSAPANP